MYYVEVRHNGRVVEKYELPSFEQAALVCETLQAEGRECNIIRVQPKRVYNNAG